jgi:glycogen synthase
VQVLRVRRRILTREHLFATPFQAIAAKALNKEALQAAAGLPVDRKIPLVAFVGRLEEQKGPDVMAAAIPQLMEEDVQIVLLVRST